MTTTPPPASRRALLLASALALVGGSAAMAQDMPGMSMPTATPAPAASPPAKQDDDMAGMDMAGQQSPSDMKWMMKGAFGPYYPMSREASGTAWQPDASEHPGIHGMSGDWMTMVHVTLNGVWDSQSGPRGDDKAFVSGMVMASAKRPLANGDMIQFKAMFSPDPFMGKSGYPLLLASGETADGTTHLVDRQHPHDLFMELSASYAKRIGEDGSVFLYAGLPGEPAFGPPAFMHRLSILDSPEAPISHHWLDSTHITFGVVTLGYGQGPWKIEASRFRGREPDQYRFNIETGALDSTAVRVSWNPTRNWALQASWADVKSPEQLEPLVDQTRWSASAIYTVPFGDGGWWSTTAAWGRRSDGTDELDAWALESAVRPNDRWTVFSRLERTENDELVPGGTIYTVGKASIGAVRDWSVSERVKFGLGGLYSVNFVPGGLKSAYGDSPDGAMAFVRLKIE
ncbi:hypothetical protein QO010_002371 [Caulobacter ginsengisoli]|uniref:Uncharacterized protein n=1 Tax=Caulobacter ginsengisoli TaxID=400775 RepID=A0ABU0IRE9_9CAUL|nr:hypothetical protein [Caulobacter ginsengisoli]MDQ0464587.1 hypothetical protein [Caulobacter ginsengisoli]